MFEMPGYISAESNDMLKFLSDLTFRRLPENEVPITTINIYGK